MKLYTQLARVYHEMYSSLFDYKKEFQRYDKVLRKYKCKKILEIGCGTGNLSAFFVNAKYEYVGLDLFNEMLKIAKENAPHASFIRGDMRKIRIKEKFDAILITGKTFTYMTTNKDIINALKSVNNHLRENGILMFDNYNAQKLIELKTKRFTQEVTYGKRKYKRVSVKTPNLKEGWTENWRATYFITENGDTKKIKDEAVVRSFTPDEIELFLKISEFEVLENKKEDAELITVARKK